MKTTTTITVKVTADESVLSLDLAEIRASIARTLCEDYSVNHDQHGYEEGHALLTGIKVDGQVWNHEKGALVGYEWITPEVERMLKEGRKINAIKQIREDAYNAGLPMGLAEAKAIVDKWSAR